MKPSAYISDGGVMFKDSPPDSILKLNPLYTSAEIKELHNLVEKQRAEINCLKNKYNKLSNASLSLCNIVDKVVTDE